MTWTFQVLGVKKTKRETKVFERDMTREWKEGNYFEWLRECYLTMKWV